MSQELKPCPFCGSTNLNVTAESSYVMCYGCDADGPVTRPSTAAIAAWNNRPAPAPPAGRQLESRQYVLRAMARNYRNGHSWDHLDGEAVSKAADEINRLQAENAALHQRLNVAYQKSDEAVTLIRELYNSKGPALSYRFRAGVEEFFAKHFPQ